MRPAELADEGADRLARGGPGAVGLLCLDRLPKWPGLNRPQMTAFQPSTEAPTIRGSSRFAPCPIGSPGIDRARKAVEVPLAPRRQPEQGEISNER